MHYAAVLLSSHQPPGYLQDPSFCRRSMSPRRVASKLQSNRLHPEGINRRKPGSSKLNAAAARIAKGLMVMERVPHARQKIPIPSLQALAAKSSSLLPIHATSNQWRAFAIAKMNRLGQVKSSYGSLSLTPAFLRKRQSQYQLLSDSLLPSWLQVC